LHRNHIAVAFSENPDCLIAVSVSIFQIINASFTHNDIIFS